MIKSPSRYQVAIEAEHKMQFSMDLSYIVSHAGWEPTYDVRLAANGKEAELVYRALVRQKSGEDWPGVKLVLSTAKPEVGGAPGDQPAGGPVGLVAQLPGSGLHPGPGDGVDQAGHGQRPRHRGLRDAGRRGDVLDGDGHGVLRRWSGCGVGRV